MRNPLLKSMAIVFVVWYLVLFAFSNTSILDMPRVMLRSAAVTAMGVAVGIIAMLLWLYKNSGDAAKKVQGQILRGAKTSIGPILQSGTSKDSIFCQRAPIPEHFWDQFSWWSAYQIKYPQHAALFRACASAMFAQEGMPASPVPGGHGGASLIKHSISVTKKMLELAPAWVYVGHKDKSGTITFGMIDETKINHSFYFEKNTDLSQAEFDPLLPLCAFIHDIGKLRCYKNKIEVKSNKYIDIAIQNLLFWERKNINKWCNQPFEVVEIKRNHDIEGARLLRALPELFQLPMNDRDALVIAIGHYHHINGLTLSPWVDDKMRSLIHLLHFVDVATGMDEGDESARAFNIDIDIGLMNALVATPTAVTNTMTEPTIVKTKGISAKETLLDKTIIPAPSAGDYATEFDKSNNVDSCISTVSVITTVNEPGNTLLTKETTENDQFIKLAAQILSKTARTNGVGKGSCAYKVGKYIYIYEEKLRQFLSEEFNKPDLLGPSSFKSTHPFTLSLIDELHAHGWLYTSHNSVNIEPEKALWDVEFEKKSGEIIEKQFVIIASLDAFPFLAGLSDAVAMTVKQPTAHSGNMKSTLSEKEPKNHISQKAQKINGISSVKSADTDADMVNKHDDGSKDDNAALLSALDATIAGVKPVLTAKKLKELTKNMEYPFKSVKDKDGISVNYFKITDLEDNFWINKNNIEPGLKIVKDGEGIVDYICLT